MSWIVFENDVDNITDVSVVAEQHSQDLSTSRALPVRRLWGHKELRGVTGQLRDIPTCGTMLSM